MKRVLGWLVAIVLLLAAAYLSTPYYTVWRIVQAARQHDAKTISTMVNFPAVRASLKPQLASALRAEIEKAKPKPQNLLEQIGAMIAPVFVGDAVDQLVTPEGVAVMLRTGHAPHNLSAGARPENESGDEAGPGDPKLVELGYNGTLFDLAHHKVVDLDLDQFHASVVSRAHPEQRVNLIFLREGLFTWKLSSIDLPALSGAKPSL